jgi:hypothetical protein
MNKITPVLIAALFAAVSGAHAQTSNTPVSQGEASVDKNLQKNPTNPGLNTADQRLEQNEAKIAAKRKTKHKSMEEVRENKAAELHERERVGHPGVPERPGIPERPEK